MDDAAPNPASTRPDVSFPTHLALRDLAIVGLTLAVWSVYRPIEHETSTGVVSLAILVGVLTAVSGFLVHEWGHWAGARLGGSLISHPRTLASIFLFKFADEGNDRRQFLLMANGGFVVSAATIAFLLATLSFDVLGDRIALGLSALGVLATFVLEVPPALRVYRGGPIPPDLVKLPD